MLLRYSCITSCTTLHVTPIQHMCCDCYCTTCATACHLCMSLWQQNGSKQHRLHANNSPSQKCPEFTSISFWSCSEAMALLLLPTPAPLACMNGAPSGCPPGAVEVKVMPCLSIHGGRTFCVAGPLASALAPPSAPEGTIASK